MEDSRTEKLYQIKKEVMELKESPLYELRKKNNTFPVIGEGNHYAKIMFIGEAPGRREAETGRPFCGSAGAILDMMLEAIGIKREDVYITNILKDRPPKNRDPSEEEINIYSPFLDRQIKIIKPKLICPLGRFSAKYILNKYKLLPEPFSISKIHGRIYSTAAEDGSLSIVPLKHPATAVYDPSKKDDLLEGFRVIKKEGLKNE